MKILLDVLVLVIIGLSMFIGIKKGFIKTVLGLCGVFLVFLLAYKLSVPFGNYLDGKVVNSSMRSSVSEKIAEKIGVELQDGDEQAQLSGFETQVAEFARTEEGSSLLDTGKAEIMAAAEEAKGNVVQTIFAAVDKASAAVARIIAVVILLIAGVLLLLLLKLVAKPTLKLLHMSKFDAALGGMLGFVRGVLFVLILAFAVRLALPAVSDKLSRNDIEHTLVFKYAYSVVDGE